MEAHGCDDVECLQGQWRPAKEDIGTYHTHADHAGGEDGASTQVRHQNPRDRSSNDKHRVQDHVEGERESGADTSLLEELDTLTDE